MKIKDKWYLKTQRLEDKVIQVPNHSPPYGNRSVNIPNYKLYVPVWAKPLDFIYNLIFKQ